MNILYIMCDSLPPQLLSMYGGPAGATPNLDRLAERGVVFRNAYCNSPLCAPARASMVTGRYVSQIGAFDNANEFSSEWPTIGHVMSAAGLEPTIVGKMHFVGHDQNHGFNRVANDADYTDRYKPEDYGLAYDWKSEPHGNPFGVDWMAPSYVHLDKWDHYTLHHDWDEQIHREAMGFLSGKDSKSDPFFCCVSYHAPHNPYWIPEEYRERFRDADLPIPNIPDGIDPIHGPMDEWLNTFHRVGEIADRLMTEENLRWLYETFYGMLYHLDEQIGELLAVLDRQGLTEDTAIVFAADHGDMLAHRGMVQKRYLYERSIGVPLIFSFPGSWREGAEIETPVSLIDILPTLADMAGVPPPDDLPGMSLLPSLVAGAEPEERTIYCEYHGEGVHAPCFAAIRGRHKYVCVHGHEERLYDLESDPDEFHNLLPSEEYAPLGARMKQALLRQFDPERITEAALQSQRNRGFVYGSLFG